MLFPLLDQIPIDEAAADWPDVGEVSAAKLIRFLILAKTCGRARVNSFCRDPALRDLFSIPPGLVLQEVAEWSRQIAPAEVRHLQQLIDRSHLQDSHDGQRDAGLNRTDLNYLRAPSTFGLSAPFDRALSKVAQTLLRAFARRLVGFSASNPEYLYSNFLDLTARIEEEPHRIVVQLSHAPLHVILNMTGMLRCEYSIEWLGERPFAIYPEG